MAPHQLGGALANLHSITPRGVLETSFCRGNLIVLSHRLLLVVKVLQKQRYNTKWTKKA